MTDTFTWRPLDNPQGAVKLRVKSAQFGDNYSQEGADGLNNKGQSWPLQFGGTKAGMQAICDFFDAHGGYIAFYWTPPLGVQGLYKVTDYSPMPQGGPVYTISATFVQKFAP